LRTKGELQTGAELFTGNNIPGEKALCTLNTVFLVRED